MKQEEISAFNKLKEAIILVSGEDLKQAIRECLQEHFNDVQTSPKQDELIGTSEACKILGCCSRTMQRYRDLKVFPFKRVGPHKALYFRSDIEAFRDSNLIRR